MATVTIQLTETQARRACTTIAARVFDMDEGKPYGWYEPGNINPMDYLGQSNAKYRAELMEIYDSIMQQITEGVTTCE